MAGALDEYRSKRDFRRTPEPTGGAAAAPAPALGGRREPRFVIQRHRARRLHYDLRLEADGVLLSWAVPKGVTLDPSARHLAVRVEDHPIEYADFEGIIPAGDYGGGDVIVWDRGSWTLHAADSARAAVEAGELHFELNGSKVRGRFVLVRTRPDGGKEQWLLLHKRDEHAVRGWDPEDHPRSMLSGRTNDEVAADPDRVWDEHGERSLRLDEPSFEPPTAEELAALDELGPKGRWSVGGIEVALTNLDKELFPGRGRQRAVTKRDLVRYFATIAPVMLPHLLDRPLNLHRFPDGVERPGFWQKEAPGHTPAWIRRWHNEDADEGESQCYLVADRVATLVWLANHAAVELHAWTSRIPDVHRPTYALVDLDPGTDTTWNDLLTLARLHRDALDHLQVVGYPKVTGRRGIQIWIPITPGPSFDETRAWVEGLSRAVGKVVPELVSWKWSTRERGGRARLDYTQNAINKTLVAPFSPRPAPGAPVSVPIRWEELDDPALRPDRWTIRSVGDRVAEVGDPMAPARTQRQSLPALT